MLEMRQLFLTIKTQLLNTEEKRERYRELALGTYTVMNATDKIHGLMLIFVSKSLRGCRICSLKLSPPRHLPAQNRKTVT